jgi:serine/threonine-protein kinase
MADTVELQPFKTRWLELGLAETAPALPIGATIRQGTLVMNGAAVEARPASWTRPDPKDLPRISLAYGPMDVQSSVPPQSDADLEVRGVIGEGGMGRVHEARQRSLERDVAVKTLKADARNDQVMTSLLREAVITGSLEHPGIVPVHALGLDPRGAPVLVMKRIDGVEWRALIDDANHDGWETRAGDRLVAHLEILLSVCQAVQFAHSRGVIHCDIKPENVMLGEFGEVCLVDWGVAMRAEDAALKNARTGLVGTPAYMAPELVTGGSIGPHTDVYLLGASLHHVLTGRYRHDGKTLEEALRSAFESKRFSYDPAIPGELAEIANRAMSQDPAARHASVAEFRQAILDYLQHRSSIALADAASERMRTLAAMFETAGSEPPADLRRAYQLVAEGRYGFTQALEEWSENVAAREGLRGCVLLAVELELRQEHLQSAEALLSELGKAPKDLTERVRELRHHQARARAEEKRLRGLAHDLDTSVSSKERGRVLAAVGGAMLAVAIYAVSQPNPNRLRPISLLAFSVLLFTVVLMAVFAARKYLFKNAFNRRLVGVLLLTGITLIGSRNIGWRVGMPVPMVFVQDLVALTAIGAAATILMSRHLWPIPVILAAAATGCVLEPSWCVTFFSLSALACLPLIAFGLWRHRQEEERLLQEEVPESIRLDE